MRAAYIPLMLFLFSAAPLVAQEEKKPAVAEDADRSPRVEITVRGAKDEAAVKQKLRADALLARCVIKPVMTDEEIALCKSAYKQTAK